MFLMHFSALNYQFYLLSYGFPTTIKLLKLYYFFFNYFQQPLVDFLCREIRIRIYYYFLQYFCFFHFIDNYLIH